MNDPRKILVMRLSSMGDIMLTTPVLRSLRNRFPAAEIHFLVKAAFSELLIHNSCIDKLHLFTDNLSDTTEQLRAENFDLVIDLHNSIRSKLFRNRLKKEVKVLDKHRVKTWLYIKWRIGSLPQGHVVDRYFDVVRPLGCVPPESGLEITIPESVSAQAKEAMASFSNSTPIAVVLGATKATKRWPIPYFIELINQLNRPVIVIGGKAEMQDAELLTAGLNVPIMNIAGKCSLLEGAARMRECAYVITHDTGFMHIAAAMKMKIFTLWGHTVPALGFYPWKTEWISIENKELKCRPCDKIGYDQCPKGHFKCMMELTPEKVLGLIQQSGWNQ